MYCDGDDAEVFFHLSLQDVRSGSVQHVAESVVYLGEESGFIDPCLVFKRDECHEFTADSVDRFAGDLPANRGHLFPHMGMEISGPDTFDSFEDIFVAVERVDRKKET